MFSRLWPWNSFRGQIFIKGQTNNVQGKGGKQGKSSGEPGKGGDLVDGGEDPLGRVGLYKDK